MPAPATPSDGPGSTYPSIEGFLARPRKFQPLRASIHVETESWAAAGTWRRRRRPSGSLFDGNEDLVYVVPATGIRAPMQARTESLAERVERLVEDRRKPLLSTASTSAAIAELVGRIESLELAIQEIAEEMAVTTGIASSRRETA